MTEHDDPFAMVRRRLLRQASIFDDPAAYAAGVEDALAAVARSAALTGTQGSVRPQEPSDRRDDPLSSPLRGAVG